MDFIDYREKLGIGFNDDEKTNIFLHRIFNFLDKIASRNDTIYESSDLFSFCNSVGICFPGSHVLELRFIFNFLKQCRSLEDFLSYYLFFVKTIPDKNDTLKGCAGKRVYMNMVKDLLRDSHISFDIIEENGDSFIFPKGAKELDDALVSQPLEWLKDYPNARKTYVTALKQYSDGEYIRDTADNLRKALETFLQEFLNNSKNLETNKNEICKYLGSQGVDAGISGLFQPLINSYKNINDRIAKHNDAVDEKLLEFLLYQTGVLIRMAITVKKSENASSQGGTN